VCVLLFMVGTGTALAAEGLPDPAAPGLSTKQRLDSLIERVKLEQNGMATLEADFVQHKQSTWLIEPEEARGVFSYSAPDQVRWEYLSPNPIVVMIREKELTTWYRDLGKAERLKIQKYSSQIFKYLGASGSLQTLMEYFTVHARFPQSTAEPYLIELSPRYARIARRVTSMALWIDSRTFVPVRVRYEEPNGDLTEYRFENVRINSEIPSERFELELPPEVDLRVLRVDRVR
jgi:outer membrane lipoprotein-sorting protein